MTDDRADNAIVRELKILNKKGLHARASAKFVQCVDRFEAEVCVLKDGQSVSGTSIMGLMMLAAGIGSSIEVRAVGATPTPSSRPSPRWSTTASARANSPHGFDARRRSGHAAAPGVIADLVSDA